MSKAKSPPTEERWAIDLDWLESSNRSVSVLAIGSLCPGCRKKIKVATPDSKKNDLLKTIHTCCSRHPDFITPDLPFQESIFRIFLANGNKPLSLKELGDQLSQRRGINLYNTSETTLARLLKSADYYGIRPSNG
ncbi:MAG: hypothetical protein JW856_05750 [Dehalococcoidales bacterium]|nr:hypothetical protein [Dehalococcoidales bacterium]